MKVIAIVGMTGSGKSDVSQLFVNSGYSRVRFGDITEEHIREKGKEVTVETERIEREKLRKEHGMHAYAKLNLPKIVRALEEGSVVVDGLYSWEEYLFLKEKFPRLIVVAVYAPPDLRYERLVQRDIRALTKEQSQARDIKEIENVNKAGPIAMADYTIMNVGTVHDLHEKYDKFLEWMRENEAEMG